MTITFKEINGARKGGESYQKNGTTVTKRTRQWRVDTTNNYTDDADIMADAAAVKIGQVHDNDSTCRCIDRACAPESQAQKRQWLYTAMYSSEVDIREDPLDDPAETEWSTETYQTIAERDIDGDSIVNSAGDPFDPPGEKDDSRWTSVTRKNITPAVPDWIFAYQDGVNSDSFTVDDITITAGWAKLSSIHLSTKQQRNGTEYRVITLTINYRTNNEGIGSGSGSYGSGSDEDEPWQLTLLDAGFRELSGTAGSSGSAGGSAGGSLLVNIKDSGGDDVTAPVPLDGNGYALDEPTPQNAIFLTFQIYHDKIFQDIQSMFT